MIQQYSIKLDSTYLIIDNSPRCWNTFELKTDTIFQIENNLYFFNNKTIQFRGVTFDNGKPEGVTDSFKAEEYALQAHKKWELDFQKKALKSRLKDGEQLFLNIKGKPFLIWWYESPLKSKNTTRSIEIKISSNVNTIDTAGIDLNVTHQLYLDCITNGNTCYTLSIPVLESETLQKEILKLKTIANTFNVYGSFIDIDLLNKRLKSENNYIFKDSFNLIEIDVPEWLNIVKSPIKNSIFGSFPEKDNIINAVGITWEYKTKNSSFSDFVNKDKVQHDNQQVIIDNEKIRREFFTKQNSTFYCQNIYLAGDNIFCFISFTATPTTYYYNLQRLDKLIENVKLK